jgi:hypothetical protein
MENIMSELYLFNDGATNTGFTPTLFSKTLSAITYNPAIVKRSDIILTDVFAKNSVTFTFSKANSYAKLLVQSFAERVIQVTIFKDDVAYWKGEVVSAESSPASISIVCNALGNNIRRKSNGARLSLHCWKQIYDSNCGLNKASFVVNYTSITASSRVITVTGLVEATGYFDNGFAEMGGQSRRILTQVGTTVTLAEAFTGTLTGTISLYPVCNLTEASCTSFSNLNNYGGFARIPTKNPMGNSGLL